MRTRAERQFPIDGGELFGSTPAEIVRWVDTTRPTPPPEDVAAHVAWLHDEGIVSNADLDALARMGIQVPAS